MLSAYAILSLLYHVCQTMWTYGERGVRDRESERVTEWSGNSLINSVWRQDIIFFKTSLFCVYSKSFSNGISHNCWYSLQSVVLFSQFFFSTSGFPLLFWYYIVANMSFSSTRKIAYFLLLKKKKNRESDRSSKEDTNWIHHQCFVITFLALWQKNRRRILNQFGKEFLQNI